jgi:hypothetical protein
VPAAAWGPEAWLARMHAAHPGRIAMDALERPYPVFSGRVAENSRPSLIPLPIARGRSALPERFRDPAELGGCGCSLRLCAPSRPVHAA